MTIGIVTIITTIAAAGAAIYFARKK